MLKINMDDSSQLTGTHMSIKWKVLIGEIDLLFLISIPLLIFPKSLLANLEEFLARMKLKNIKYFVYQTDEEDGEQYPAGISLRSLSFKGKFHQEEAVMGIGSTASNQENTVRCWVFYLMRT